MNEEVYSECIVAAKRPSWVIPAWIGLGVSLAAAVYFLLCMNFLLMLLATIVFIVLLILLVKFGSVEYEYLYLMDELTIDAVYRKSSRKNKAVIPLQEVEMICPTEESDAERMRGMGDQVDYRDFSSGLPENPSYTIKTVSGGKTHFVRFEPNEKMLKQLRHSHPGKVKIRK